MKIKKAGLMIPIAAALALSGCQLARKDAQTGGGDRLAGVLVTTEYLDLFDMDRYLNDHAKQIMKSGTVTVEGNTGQYEGRLYGEPEGDGYVFEGAPGIVLLELTRTGPEGEWYQEFHSGEGFTDVHSAVSTAGDGETVSLEATVYVEAEKKKEYPVYHINPVYQTSDGKVYVTTGQGVSAHWDGEEGIKLSQSMSETVTTTKNGKAQKETMSLNISIISMNTPEKIRILQMDEESRLILREEYTPGRLPAHLTPSPQTAYLILETDKTDSQGTPYTTRTLFTPENETLQAFYLTPNGICAPQEVPINWPKN